MKKILMGGAVAAFAFALGASFALADVNNGSFEQGSSISLIGFSTLTAPNNSIDSWTVNSGSVDYTGDYWQSSNGDRSLDMNGSAPGSITQTIPTVVGGTYKVTFDLSGNPDSRPAWDALYSPSDKVLSVSASGASSKDFSFDTSLKHNTTTDMKWAGKTYSFVATGTSTDLTFASQTPGAFGPALDNVLVTQLTQ